MIFATNTSPWAGREGDYVTSRKLRERLVAEQRRNVSVRIEDTESPDAMRVTGTDFFCGLTFPVRDSHCSLIVGGWGGSLVGISSIDNQDASENETTQFIGYENGRWYRIRLRVSETKIEAWIEQKKIVDVVTTGRKLSLRPGEIERSVPFGLATWVTTGAFREIKLRRVDGPAEAGPRCVDGTCYL